ncbi:MAG: hypothetical protein J7518_16570 [Nocardioidaceae bacterium]|nr:hypothetical protein [Nocardioidaceae bacterium]
MMTDLRVTLDRAELAYTTGDVEAGMQGANEVLAALDSHPEASADAGVGLRRDARRLRAAALETGGEFRQAITVLEQLADEPMPDAAWLRGLIALSRCRREIGDFDGASRVLDDARDTIERLGVDHLTEAVQLTVTVGSAHTSRGDLVRARIIAKKALADADRHDTVLGRASALWNLAIIESLEGRHPEAVTYLNQAVVAFEEGEDSRNLPRVRGTLALTLLDLDPPDVDRALREFEQTERELAWLPTNPVDLARYELGRARAYLLVDRIDKAADAISRCAALTPREAGPIQVWVKAFKGRLEATRGDAQAAEVSYQEATAQAMDLGTPRSAAQLWLELGGLLDELGHADAAKDASPARR